MVTRRKGKARSDSSEPGQDSFLDVVANLIGILIILVMLIGSQAQSVWEKMRSTEKVADSVVEELKSGVESAQTSVAKLKSENAALENQIVLQANSGVRVKQERDRLQLAVQAFRETLDQRRAELTQEEQKRQKLVSQVSFLKEELASVEGQKNSLQFQMPQAGVIDHLPTPIAKTVFGEEVHFRLQGGRLVYVPLDELVLMMRSEWKVKAKKLVQTPQTIETVGPVQNFRLQYKLILREVTQRTDHGVVKSVVPGLDRFILLPTRDGLGEPFEEAILPGSRFSKKMASLDPNGATISVWVYPDSFGQFNRLKKLLYDSGFLCAGWPLPENQPISGSPNGFRTAAQ